MRDFSKGGGDFAARLLEGMLARAESGSFGEWASDAPAFDKQRPNCTLFANDFSQQGLETFAANQKADVLVSLNFSSKAAGRKNRVVTLVIHVVDVARNSELWASQPLTSTALMAGRSKGEDPGLELINELLKYLDENLALEADRTTVGRRGRPTSRTTRRRSDARHDGQARRAAGVSVPEAAHRGTSPRILRQTVGRRPAPNNWHPTTRHSASKPSPT